MRSWLLCASAVALLGCAPALAETSADSAQTASAQRGARVLVRTQAEFTAASRNLKPGDVLVLANGEWKDFQIVFTGQGQANAPIVLTAETPGQVILTGQSNLRMAGQHLVVQSLVFRNGWSPTGEVVSFRRTRTDRATNSRVTGVVIDSFNKPDRAESDNWVALYGHHNRFDHGHLVGKTNAGTTLVVVRDEEQGLANHHLIDHNYFGPRPPLGSNGGETMRIGTSHDAESDSFTTVENNWFERADGEVEIISNKSGANTYRGNVFFESQGALTLRHGDGNTVENNVFIGNGVPNTGGVRVINRNQTVRNNYMEGLRGEGFASALTVMYGVPSSPANRYVQVTNAVIENNTIVDAHSVFFGAGMDEERSAAPVGSRFANNLIVNRDGRDPVRVLGDLSGLAMSGNVQSPRATARLPGAFVGRELAVARGPSRLFVAEGAEGVGASRDLTFVAKAATGVSWYPKTVPARALDSGQTVQVRPGEDTLTAALAAASAGDRLTLQAGDYVVNQVLPVTRPVTVEGPSQGEARIAFSRPTLFEVGKGGALRLNRLSITGKDAPDAAGNAVIRTRGDAQGHSILIENSRISDLTVNRAFHLLSAAKGSHAERVVLDRVTLERVSGTGLSLHAETDNQGTYNAERVEV